jgi:hypothetical protein
VNELVTKPTFTQQETTLATDLSYRTARCPCGSHRGFSPGRSPVTGATATEDLFTVGVHFTATGEDALADVDGQLDELTLFNKHVVDLLSARFFVKQMDSH